MLISMSFAQPALLPPLDICVNGNINPIGVNIPRDNVGKMTVRVINFDFNGVSFPLKRLAFKPGSNPPLVLGAADATSQEFTLVNNQLSLVDTNRYVGFYGQIVAYIERARNSLPSLPLEAKYICNPKTNTPILVLALKPGQTASMFNDPTEAKIPVHWTDHTLYRAL